MRVEKTFLSCRTWREVEEEDLEVRCADQARGKFGDRRLVVCGSGAVKTEGGTSFAALAKVKLGVQFRGERGEKRVEQGSFGP